MDGRTAACTDRAGRAVLRGDEDFWCDYDGERWVGGTRLGSGAADWRWDAEAAMPRLRGAA